MKTRVVATMFSCIAAISAAHACPEDFDEFASQFAADVAFQRAHTQFPLRYQYVDPKAFPEPKQVEANVTRERAADFPGVTYPSPTQQGAALLQRIITSPDADTRIVTFEKADTDYLIKFTFKKSVPCWELVSIDDASL